MGGEKGGGGRETRGRERVGRPRPARIFPDQDPSLKEPALVSIILCFFRNASTVRC